MNRTLLLAMLPLVAPGAGCVSRPAPVTMAPPIAPPPPPAVATQNNQVWDWHDVPKGQKIPITRGVFDQGGYQLYAKTGETIIVPFENQNMYVLKFGQTSGETYFIVENDAPTLYLRDGQFLENASAQGAKWYPFSPNHHYERPVYIGLAPSWADYLAMGWYAGMIYHGGYWGYRPWYPGFPGFSPMVGLNINIGGRGYDWAGYRDYYRNNPTNRYNVRNTYNYNSVGRRAPSTFGRRAPGPGSFGRSAPGPSGSFGRSAPGSGSFGRSAPGFGSFGRRSPGSFGSGPSGYSRPSGSFGRRPGGSFGGFGRSSGGFGRRSSGFGRRR